MRQPKRGKQFVEEISNFKVPEQCFVIWHLNQFGYAMKQGNQVIYIDPYLSDDLVNATKGKSDQHTKIFEPLLQGRDIDNADYVFCTHDHLDHLDPTCVLEISEASPKAMFVVPHQASTTMQRLGIASERIIYMNADETRRISDMRVRTFKGAHESFDYDDERGYAFLGFHIEWNGFNVYHSGDTILFDNLVSELQTVPVDIAILPINGREYQKLRNNIRGNMNFKEAAEFAVEINADYVIPGHWGMHYENTEKPGNFVDYITEKYTFQKFRIMAPGDRFIYCKSF